MISSDRAQLGNSGTNPPMTRAQGGSGEPGRGMGVATPRKGTKPIFAAHTFEETYKDNRNIEKTARMYSEMVGFKNLANSDFVVKQARMAVQNALTDTYSSLEYLRNKFLVCYRLYRGETLNQYNYGRMAIHSPTPYKIVESIHPRIMRTIFGNDRWFQLYGEGEEHDQPARAQEALCRDQFRAMSYKSKASRMIRDGLIYGTGIQKTYWKQDAQERAYRVARRVPNPDIPGASKVELEDVERNELMFDGNDVCNVSIFDFYAPPSASSAEEADWLADRQMWPDFRVKQMVELGHWINLEALKDNPGQFDPGYEDPFKQRKAYAYGVYDGRVGAQAAHIPYYEVVDWWGPLVIEDNNGNYKTRNCNVIIIDPKGLNLVARVTVNPFWHGKKPYQVWRYQELEQELFGIGAIEPIARLSVEKDTKRALLMAATQLEANPMVVVSDQANLPGGALARIQPGLIIRAPDPSNAVVPIALSPVSDSALKAENILEAEMREVSGVTAPVLGTSDPMGGSSKTATQSVNDLNEANMRLSNPITNWDLMVTVPMLEQMTWNNMQFQSYEKVVRDLGVMGMSFRDRWMIRPEDLIGRFIVQPLSGYNLSTKQTQVQQLVNFLDRAPIVNQSYGPNTINEPKLMAYILEHGFDIRNVDEFIALGPEDSKMMPALEEHEMWYHGNVPPRRSRDNDVMHAMAHLEEFKSERFEMLEASDPGTAARARAHAADHLRKAAMLQEIQNQTMMLMQQAASAQGLGGTGEPSGSGEGGMDDGAAEPGQDPESPKVRASEQERSVKSEAMASAPNRGAE